MAAVAAIQSVNKPRYDIAEVVLFDPVAPNRSTTRTALNMMGFRQIFATSDYGEMLGTLRGKIFDLFIADITQDTSKICDLVGSMRSGTAGGNPFVHVVLMAWKLEDDLVKRALNCGADDLITRPYSVGFLSGRMKSLTEARKSFVVTSDYIGPDRRRDPTRGVSAIPMFDVPNTLRMRTRPDAQLVRIEGEIPNAIRESRAKINAERARRDVFHLSVIGYFVQEALTATQPLERDLDRLDATLSDLTQRLESGSNETAKLCGELGEAISGAKSGEKVADHVRKIQDLAASLYLALNQGRTAADLKAELDKVVALIKSRGRRD
ncbi:MAG: response regulator [Alphaproteobacteria bacterium]|nr:response regulator [Alphaproteobacteria bacterium]